MTCGKVGQLVSTKVTLPTSCIVIHSEEVDIDSVIGQASFYDSHIEVAFRFTDSKLGRLEFHSDD